MTAIHRRQFVRHAAAGAMGLSGALALAAEAARPAMVGDRLWLWGHPAGCHTKTKDQWGLPGTSKIAPAEAAALLGIRNLLMVRYDLEPKPPFAKYAEAFRGLDRVVWSVEGGGGGDVGAVLDLRSVSPNLEGIMLDDYFGRVASLAPKMWLAENGVRFPVTLTATFLRPVPVDRIELKQSAWATGDYRSKDFAIDLAGENNDWTEAGRGSLPNCPLASAEVRLPGSPVRRIRVRILGTHDVDKARSCGLAGLRLFAEGKPLDLTGVRLEASSHYPDHPPSSLLAGVPADKGPFSLAALRGLRKKLDAGPRRLDLWVVLYTHEFSFGPLLRPHLDLCDVVTMWTWRAEDLRRLDESFARFEQIVGKKRRVLGLYLWDYGTKQPLPLDLMERQCTLGLRWLREGRIDGMIFLASCICDLDLQTVAWTRRWIAAHGAEKL